MIKKLLKQSTGKKLELFRYIIIQKPVSIKELMDVFQFSRTTIKRMLQEVSSDLESLGIEGDIVQSANFSYSFVNRTEDLSRIYHQLTLFYCQQSTVFQLLKLNYLESDLTVSDCCEKMNISEAYCYKVINETNQFLKDFHIKIVTQQKTLTFDGEEASIRLLGFYLFSHTYLGVEWPFIHIEEQQITQQLTVSYRNFLDKKSFSEKQTLYFWYAVNSLRASKGYMIEEMDAQTQEILRLISIDYPIFKPKQLYNFEITPEDYQKELYFSTFIVQVQLSKVFELSGHLRKIGNQIRKLDYPIVHLLQQIISEFDQHFDLSMSENEISLLMYQMVFPFIRDRYVSYGKDKFVEVIYHYASLDYAVSKRRISVIDFLDYFAKEKSPKEYKFFVSNNKIFIVGILYATLIRLEKKQIRIYIHNSLKGMSGESLIRYRLENLFNPKTVRIVNHIEEADLIISDSMEEERNPKTKIFFLEDLNNQYQWEHLFDTILALLEERVVVNTKEMLH
ncbi:hypothetical protein IGI37_000889 [Enterococcus sp. AZ194]|uniref:helix-turn-helix domain-containing protein n=1 Tax=Enterococcus sp. AZ194 TaxID=2774629 RepID=UPI003F273767